MTSGIDALTDKEKQTLRLIGRGHDAKSCARELGLSVHTVNERLRDARRKLGVTSSREAARMLSAHEQAHEMPGDKLLGDAPRPLADAQQAASAPRRWAGPRLAAILVGVSAMSLIIAALLLPASPIALLAPAAHETAASAASETAAPARAAETFLALIDESRWAESYAMTGAQFRKANTLESWSEASQSVRPMLGKVVTRDLVGNEFVPAPPHGYRLIKFRSAYAGGTTQTESVSLAFEDGAWRVAGIVFD